LNWTAQQERFCQVFESLDLFHEEIEGEDGYNREEVDEEEWH
jgi:hypothetical protein